MKKPEPASPAPLCRPTPDLPGEGGVEGDGFWWRGRGGGWVKSSYIAEISVLSLTGPIGAIAWPIREREDEDCRMNRTWPFNRQIFFDSCRSLPDPHRQPTSYPPPPRWSHRTGCLRSTARCPRCGRLGRAPAPGAGPGGRPIGHPRSSGRESERNRGKFLHSTNAGMTQITGVKAGQ